MKNYDLIPNLGTALIITREAMSALGFKMDCFQSVLDAYSEPHRFYHNLDHLKELGNKILDLDHLTDRERNLLLVAAAYHDFVYDPKSTGGNNELLSVEKFRKDSTTIHHWGSTDPITAEEIELISDIILATSKREKPEEKLASIFWNLDNSILLLDTESLFEYERKIFLEYQCFNYLQYAPARSKFLEEEFIRTGNLSLKILKEYVKARKPRVGVYPGSFNPFHKGHLNVLNKAEKIFDKVIIVKAKNPEKDGNNAFELPSEILNREIIEWDGLTTDLITNLSQMYEPTLIRGLRNGKDLDYEVNQLRFMEEMKPDLKACFVQCDKEFEHISSSAIRNILKFSEVEARKYLI